MNKVSFKIFKEVFQESNTFVMPLSQMSTSLGTSIINYFYTCILLHFILKTTNSQKRKTANPLLTMAKEKVKVREMINLLAIKPIKWSIPNLDLWDER